MKKLAMMGAAAVLALSLAACGDDDDDDAPTDTGADAVPTVPTDT